MVLWMCLRTASLVSSQRHLNSQFHRTIVLVSPNSPDLKSSTHAYTKFYSGLSHVKQLTEHNAINELHFSALTLKPNSRELSVEASFTKPPHPHEVLQA